MRALVISDTHFGAWTGEALLQHEVALDALAPHLDDVDELILLGDLFDFLFSSVVNAFAEAEPFFDLLEERLHGKRLVFLAGNHDHHIMGA
jgi:UDP-2,3-diacylglucosamine pyrophosphatase LpxH